MDSVPFFFLFSSSFRIVSLFSPAGLGSFALKTEGSEPWDKDHVAIARSELHLTLRTRLV